MASRVADVLNMEIPLQEVALNRSIQVLQPAIPGVVADMRRLAVDAASFDAAWVAAETDPDASPQGRAKAAKSAAIKGRTDCDIWEARAVGPLEARAAMVAARFASSPPARDAVVAARHEEIRRPFYAMEALERNSLYLSLPAGKEFDEVRDALETAPLVAVRVRPGDVPTMQPLIDPESVAAAQAARAAARDPSAAAELHDVRLFIRVLRSFVATARRGIDEVSRLASAATV